MNMLNISFQITDIFENVSEFIRVDTRGVVSVVSVEDCLENSNMENSITEISNMENSNMENAEMSYFGNSRSF